MSKRILSLVLALVMVLGTFGTVFAAESTGNEKVDWLRDEGLVLGDEGGLRLEDEITRAEVATMLVRALDLESVAKASMGFPSAFKDMNSPDVLWGRGYVTVAAAEGLVKGYEDGTFGPRKDITYAEVATMLVRVLGGLTEAEEKLAVGMNWATIYLTKAAQLGIFEGVSVADYSAKAERGTMFEMVYNAIVNKEFGNYTIVKAIVLENYRVEKLGKDEVVVEVIKEVQRANQLDTAIYERGDQEKLVIDAKVGDVENLLGKVADFTLDKTGKVVSIKEDTSYKQEIVEATASKNKFGSYTVELSERYKGTDERIYRTYYNNKGFAYEDFYSQDKEDRTEFEVEYAKVTTKNGKVLFIDAFNFEDIAPVKEVKANGAEVYVYNDAREGSVKRYNLTASTKVLLVKDDKVSLGSREDIAANDVIHEFNGGFIVRTDAAVNGGFEKVSQARNGDVFVHVEGEEYLVGTEANKMPVYAFDNEDQFFTLEARYAANSLKEFRNENVTVLLDLAGNLQYVGSELELGEFVGVVTKVVGRDIRVLKADGKTYDYTANLDTKVNGESTGHQGLNALFAGDLVFMVVNGETIDKVTNLRSYDNIEKVTALDTRDIRLEYDGNKRILSDTVIFVVDTVNNVYEVRTAKAVADAYKANDDAEAYVLNNKQYRVLSSRPGSSLESEAHTIVFTKIALSKDLKKVLVEFNGFADRQETVMNIIVNGTKEERKVDRDATLPSLTGGDIIEIQETKDDNKTIMAVAPVVIKNNKDNVWKVYNYDRSGNLTLENAKGERETFYVGGDTTLFGNLNSASKVKIAVDKGQYLRALLVVNNAWAVTEQASSVPTGEGIVTSVNYNVGEEAIEIEYLDGKIVEYKLTGTARVLADPALLGSLVELTFTNGRLTGIVEIKNADEVAAQKLVDDAFKLVKDSYEFAFGVDIDAEAVKTAVEEDIDNTAVTVTVTVSGDKYKVKLEATDAEPKTKTVTATNKAASKDATLKSITLGGVPLTGFSKTILNYTVKVATVPVVDATANDANRDSLVISQATNLTTDNKATIVVTAEDGSTAKTYTITFIAQ